MLDLTRNVVGFVFGLLTRHKTLVIGVADDARCRKCDLEKELSPFHIILFECGDLWVSSSDSR